MQSSRRSPHIPLGADLSHIVHETTFLNTHYGPLILPHSNFLPPLPLPPLPCAISQLKIPNHTETLRDIKERGFDTQANWEALRDRDTIVSWDGKRTVRPVKKQKGTKPSEFKFVKRTKRQLDPVWFKYELTMYATKDIWFFLPSERTIKTAARKQDIVPSLPDTQTVNGLPITGPFRRLAIAEIIESIQRRGALQRAIDRRADLGMNVGRRFRNYVSGSYSVSGSPLRREILKVGMNGERG